MTQVTQIRCQSTRTGDLNDEKLNRLEAASRNQLMETKDDNNTAFENHMILFSRFYGPRLRLRQITHLSFQMTLVFNYQSHATWFHKRSTEVLPTLICAFLFGLIR